MTVVKWRCIIGCRIQGVVRPHTQVFLDVGLNDVSRLAECELLRGSCLHPNSKIRSQSESILLTSMCQIAWAA